MLCGMFVFIFLSPISSALSLLLFQSEKQHAFLFSPFFLSPFLTFSLLISLLLFHLTLLYLSFSIWGQKLCSCSDWILLPSNLECSALLPQFNSYLRNPEPLWFDCNVIWYYSDFTCQFSIRKQIFYMKNNGNIRRSDIISLLGPHNHHHLGVSMSVILF